MDKRKGLDSVRRGSAIRGFQDDSWGWGAGAGGVPFREGAKGSTRGRVRSPQKKRRDLVGPPLWSVLNGERGSLTWSAGMNRPGLAYLITSRFDVRQRAPVQLSNRMRPVEQRETESFSDRIMGIIEDGDPEE